MSNLRFGTAGIPLSTPKKTTEGGVARLDELGLGALEIEFVRGVYLNDAKAALVKERAVAHDIALSCHAPYYINLNSPEPEKVAASRARILAAARAAHFAGAASVVFHPAFYQQTPPEEVYKKVRDEIMGIRQEIDEVGYAVILRPETTGKPSQFGDLAETVRLAQEVPGVLPCVDISHIHARGNGVCNTYDAFCRVLDTLSEALGERWNTDAHFHVSGIDYGKAGEKKHLIFAESDLNYLELARAWQTFGVKGTVICESPNLETDALILAQSFKQLTGDRGKT
ncbi:MAG: TIM barrel protein [Peptococcaceae bacterium]|nr:TIM barrel protein [Peptococcaceae bacterium]